jgi:site-specific DNA-methyltransferase (adenine-specific)
VWVATVSHVLHLGDCLDPVTGLASLPDKSVDHVICDPPYSDRVHRRLGREGRADGMEARQALAFGSIGPDTAARVAAEAVRVGRRWLVFFGDEFTVTWWLSTVVEAGGEYVRKGLWVKPDAMPQMSGDRPSSGAEEMAICHAPRPAGSGRMRWNGGGRPAIYSALVNNSRGQSEHHHPTQKPLTLMEALVRDFTDPGELVCDPFAGSGTTGVACKRLGRRFIGWEREPKYAEIARKRIEGAREQLTLGAAKSPRVKQENLFNQAK